MRFDESDERFTIRLRPARARRPDPLPVTYLSFALCPRCVLVRMAVGTAGVGGCHQCGGQGVLMRRDPLRFEYVALPDHEGVRLRLLQWRTMVSKSHRLPSVQEWVRAAALVRYRMEPGFEVVGYVFADRDADGRPVFRAIDAEGNYRPLAPIGSS